MWGFGRVLFGLFFGGVVFCWSFVWLVLFCLLLVNQNTMILQLLWSVSDCLVKYNCTCTDPHVYWHPERPNDGLYTSIYNVFTPLGSRQWQGFS